MAKTATKATKTSSNAKAKASTKTKSAKAATKTTKKAKSKSTAKSDQVLEKLDETGNRKGSDRRKKNEPVAVERRKATRRRRQIDPTTCERDYTDQEIQFMHAMDEYKQLSGRMFPTCSEILEVLKKLGYRQIADAEVVYDPDAEVASSDDEESLDDDGDGFEPCV